MALFHNSAITGASGNQGGGAGYQISRSLRFNSADSAYLSRTPASAGNRKTWTWAGWVKRSELGRAQALFGIANGGGSSQPFGFDSSDRLWFVQGGSEWRVSASVYRDTSAWYHLLIALDTTQSAGNDRIKIYVNGGQVTAFSTFFNPSQNADFPWNSTALHTIGSDHDGIATRFHFSGYLADIHFIDGQALTPTSFGEFSATTGVWMPKAYTGTYGTNGFCLTFADNSAATATTLGKDAAGSNNWTPNNLSVTAGAGNDSLVDVPTNGSETDTGAGGQVRGNYCTLNPLDKGANITLSNGNLDYSTGNTNMCRATIRIPSSGKWYWEAQVTSSPNQENFGIATASARTNTYLGGDANGWSFGTSGNKYNNNSASSYGSSCTTTDVIGVAFDADAGTLVFYKNNTSLGTAYSGLTSGPYFPAVGSNESSGVLNFGQRPFAYTAPSGFKALCTANLPAPTITQPSTVMDVKLWTGNGSTQTISGLGFSPDFVWLKGRSVPYPHGLHDTVRGVNRFLISSTTDAEIVNEQDGFISAFTSDGFTISPGSRSSATFNQNSATYAGWCWDAGSSTVTNTAGSISSQVRANASAGFSVVTYTGNGSTGTIGHGLGIAPSMIIQKPRSSSGSWAVYHASLGAGNAVWLNLTDASGSYPTVWNSTAPTSSVYSVGSYMGTLTYVAYCFAPVAGYSAFGSYTGNGSTDGPFVYTGFRPRWLLVKRSSLAGSDWNVIDAARDTYNPVIQDLAPNNSSAEDVYLDNRDFLSNGFKIRSNQGIVNTSGETYIYAAFAESPFQFSRAR